MTTSSATSHHEEVSFLLTCGSEERCHGVTVDHHTAVGHRSLGEWSAPLLLEQGDHLVSVTHRRYDRPLAEVCQQTQGVHGDDLPTGAFDQGRCPR